MQATHMSSTTTQWVKEDLKTWTLSLDMTFFPMVVALLTNLESKEAARLCVSPWNIFSLSSRELLHEALNLSSLIRSVWDEWGRESTFQ